jgi:hypothetical protein
MDPEDIGFLDICTATHGYLIVLRLPQAGGVRVSRPLRTEDPGSEA